MHDPARPVARLARHRRRDPSPGLAAVAGCRRGEHQRARIRVPFEVARRGYAVGSAVLEAVLPAHDGPTATVPVSLDDTGPVEHDGVAAKPAIIEQLAAALELIARHEPARIAPLGGDCAVSVAPFSALAHRYRDDLAIVWIDSHPDVGTPASEYPGFHAMAVAA